MQPSHGIPTRTLAEFIEAHKKIRDKKTHFQLKEDLIKHLHHPDLYPIEPASCFILYKIILLISYCFHSSVLNNFIKSVY